MDLAQIPVQIAAQWEAFKAAYVIYITGAIIVWWLAWFLGRQRLSDTLRGKDAQIAALNERLTLAHEKNDKAKQEFEGLKLEMDSREVQYRTWRNTLSQRSAPSVHPSPEPSNGHSLSASVHAVNLGRLLKDVSSATGGGDKARWVKRPTEE